MNPIVKRIMVVIGVLFGICCLVVVGINLYVHIAYSTFFNEAKVEFAMPGLNDGFVIQDMAYIDIEDSYIFSGYVDNQPSPLYRRHKDGSYDKVYLAFPDGAIYDGHGGGCSYYNNRIYVTCENGYLVFNAYDVMMSEAEKTITANLEVTLDFTPAFLNIENNVMYTGEFFFAGTYETAGWEHITTPDGTENPAIMYEYDMDGSRDSGVAEYPTKAYSIPGKVQGCCVTDDNKMVLSTSYGAVASQFLVYDTTRIIQDGEFQVSRFDTQGGVTVPLYCLDSRSQLEVYNAPPMSEGVIYKDGRVWFTDESASNKYIFGKLYGFYDVMSLKF